MGECGIRGGYAEIINMDPKVMAILLKSISAMLCPTVLGQIVMDVVVNPPKPHEPSYELFKKEKENTLRSLAERSKLVVDTLNSIPGYKVRKEIFVQIWPNKCTIINYFILSIRRLKVFKI